MNQVGNRIRTGKDDLGDEQGIIYDETQKIESYLGVNVSFNK